jgi:GH43 family beta-xylosidase
MKQTETADAGMLSNPLVEQRADPWVIKHTDGCYYHTASAPEYDRIELRQSQTLAGLGQAEPVLAWSKYEKGPMSYHIWAPELHHIDGKWYIYFAAGRSEDIWRIRTYVLENASADPTTGVWEEKGDLLTAWDTFTLDATTFRHNGVQYLVWAQQDPEIKVNTSLYIAPMHNPWTLGGKQVMISTPEYAWEQEGHKVNEGPAVLKRNGRIFITYSASATDASYCMGLLTASDTSDLMDPASWSKSAEPVFATSEATGQYGPGHNSFTVSEDGTTDILVYHARNYKEIVGSPLRDPNRHTRVQAFSWGPDGAPVFGVPVADGPYSIPPQKP